MSQPTPPDTATLTAPSAGPGDDPWAELRRHTPARIALGRAGTSLPTAGLLHFAAAHAQARDAVHVALDGAALAAELAAVLSHALAAPAPAPGPVLAVCSRAADRATYLRRPDLGRRLAEPDAARLQATASGPTDLAIVLGDGLSAVALQQHGPSLLAALLPLLPAGLRVAPLVIATQARVALADEVGALLQARLVLMLLGERPGLSAPDSLGAYLTHAPAVGRSDAERNCVSNIRPAGLPLGLAARRLAWLVREALRRQLTGVGLKDDSGTALLADTQG